MRCPFCSQIEDKVVDTRPSDNENVIRRRRECAGCGRRFTTYERIDEILPVVVKKDGRREPFDRLKIVGGLRKACTKRPVPVEELEQVVDRIERELEGSGEKEIPSSRVGDAVMAALRDIDDVAYVRFASVYWPFRDLAELQAELKNLVERRGKEVTVKFSAADERFMRRALALAERGRGTTRPNPIVGAVVVRGGRIIAEGFHRRAGEPHAEVNALNALRGGPRRRAARRIYVTLEPCCHVGRTGPCTEAVLAARPARVVVGCGDPNPLVDGRRHQRGCAAPASASTSAASRRNAARRSAPTRSG